MGKRRTIAVVTGTRAEFGLLTPVMRAIAAHPKLGLKTIVTGSHLTAGTWADVRDAGFTVDAQVPMQRKGETGRAADVEALARGVSGLGQGFEGLQPDVVLILGDRIEAFAAASAASVGGFRVAHVHGGDRAEGVADEAMRHAITKLAHLHFPATALSRKRILRMGERPEHVWNVGSPAVDGLNGVTPTVHHAGCLIVMQHPIGDGEREERHRMVATLQAVVEATPTYRDSETVKLFIFRPNQDAGAAGVDRAITSLGFRNAKAPSKASKTALMVMPHLPRPQFLHLLAGARAIVGNSSAGLIEAAVLKVPCVNIGPRQAGREKPGNVVDCDYGEQNVRRALGRALKLDLRRMRHPYGDGRAGERIAGVLGGVDLDTVPVRKRNAY